MVGPLRVRGDLAENIVLVQTEADMTVVEGVAGQREEQRAIRPGRLRHAVGPRHSLDKVRVQIAEDPDVA